MYGDYKFKLCDIFPVRIFLQAKPDVFISRGKLGKRKGIFFSFQIIMRRSLLLCYLFCGAIAEFAAIGVTVDHLVNLLPDVERCDWKNAVFKESKSYSYSYEASVENVNDEKVRTRLICDLVLNAVGKCKYVLYTYNCKLIEGLDSTTHAKSSLLEQQMEKFPIAFSMNGGNILYLSPFINDGPIILNFKKGIISSFQTMLIDQFGKDSTKEETMKWDLHGQCGITYNLEKPNVIHSHRKLNNCSLIKNNDYSELFLSIYGGVYLEDMYSSEESCSRSFRKYQVAENTLQGKKNHEMNVLESVLCEELPKPETFTLLMSFQPRIKRTLTLTSVNLMDEQTQQYSSTGSLIRITFEFTQLPKSNPPNLNKKIASLMERIVEMNNYPIELESIWLFNDLVDSLKSCSDLISVSKGVEDCWGSHLCDERKSKFAKTDHVQMKHIWRDALFKCNTRPCMKALASYIVSFPVTRSAGVFGEQMLYSIYLRWLLVGSPHQDYLQSINEVCQYTKHPLCYLALSSNINRYWNVAFKKYKLNLKVKAIVDPFMDKIKNCGNQSLKTSDILLAVKFVSNIGEYADKVYPNTLQILSKCVMDREIDWEISLSSIQAFRRMAPSEDLYSTLLRIVENADLYQELRIHAYLMLMEKFGVKAVEDVHSLLKSESLDEIFRTFIYSHIKAIIKTQDSSRYALVKALRKIVDKAGQEFLSHETYSKYVSQYMEKVYYHKSPLLPLDVSTFGYLFTQVDLYDGTSFIPFSVTRHLKITLFGTEFDLGEIAIHSKGFANVLGSLLNRLFEGGSKNSNALNYLLFNKELKTNMGNLYFGEIGKELSKSLGKVYESMQIKPSVFLNWNFLGEEAGFASFLNFLLFTGGNAGLSMGQSMFRTYMSIIGGSAEVPTTIGFSLKFVIEGEIPFALAQKTALHEIKPREKHVVGLSKFIAYGLSALIRKSSTIALKGFYELGYSDETYASTSGMVDGDFSLNMLPEGLKKLHVELPADSKLTFSFRKHHVVIYDGQRQLKKTEPLGCSPFLFGLKMCRRDVFEYNGKYPFVHKSYELHVPGDNPVAMDFQYQSVYNYEQKYAHHEFMFGAIDHERKKTHSILKAYYRLYTEKDVQEIRINSDVLSGLKFAVNLHDFRSLNYEISFLGSFGQSLSFENHLKVSDSKFVNNLFNFASDKVVMPKVKKADADGRQFQYNGLILAPHGNLSVQLVKQLFPLNYIYDLSTHFQCAHENVAHLLKSLFFESPIFWENPKSLKMDGHYEMEILLDKVVADVPESKTHAIIKLPKYKIEFNSEVIVEPDLTTDYMTSLISQTLPEKVIEWSYKYHQFRKVSSINGILSNEVVTKFLAPQLTLACLFSRNQSETIDKVAVKVQRRLYAGDSKEHETNSNDFLPLEDEAASVKELDFVFNVDKTPLEDQTDYNIDSSLKLKGFPGYDADGNFLLETDFGANFTGLSHFKTNFIHLIYNLNSSNLNRALSGESEISVGNFLKVNMILLDQSNMTSLANYSFNLNNFDSKLTLVERISSSVYNFITQMSMIYGQPHVKIDLHINASSPHWSLLDCNLTQLVSGGSETMSMSHELIDINVEASWLNGYHKSFAFNSKMNELIPTMRWMLDCETMNRCVAQMVFADTQLSSIFILYELSPGGTEVSFTLCWNDLCNQSMPNNFISKLDISILSNFRLINSLMINPHIVEELKIRILEKVSTLVLIVANAIGNPSHPLHTIYQHFVGISVDETANRILTIVPALSQTLLMDAANVFSPLFPAMYTLKEKMSSFQQLPTLQPADYNVFSLSPRQVHRLMTFSLMAADFYWDGGFRPNFEPYETWVSETPLPFELATFKEAPIKLNPSAVRYLSSFVKGKSLFHGVFYDEDYSRVALLIGNDLVMPFRGELISIENAHCHHVLCLDVEEQRFIIFKQDYWLIFIFNDTRLELSINDGQFVVNGSQREYPFESPNKEYNVIRVEDLVVVETIYHLQVICDTRYAYCTFSTDLWKYGRFYGLLGNNTDDVDPEIKKKIEDYNLKFIFNCEEENSKSVIERKLSEEEEADIRTRSACSTFKSQSPFGSSTFSCHDVIQPPSFYLKCLSRELADDSKGVQAVIKAYLAACAALGLQMKFKPNHLDNCAGHEFGSTWEPNLSKRKLEVVFLVDQDLGFNSSHRAFAKGLTDLALNIKRDFHKEVFSEIKFGLFGIATEVSVYTAGSEFWSSAEDFSLKSLSHLFANPAFHDDGLGNVASAEVFRAIRFVVDVTPFDDQAVHMLILVTPFDPFDDVKAMDFYETLKALLSRQITLHTFSNYKEFTGKASGFPFSKLKKQGNEHSLILKDEILGHYSKLSKGTKGSIWSLSHLAHKTNHKFLSDVSKELVEGSKSGMKRCLQCSCEAPRFFSPSSQCHQTQCQV